MLLDKPVLVPNLSEQKIAEMIEKPEQIKNDRERVIVKDHDEDFEEIWRKMERNCKIHNPDDLNDEKEKGDVLNNQRDLLIGIQSDQAFEVVRRILVKEQETLEPSPSEHSRLEPIQIPKRGNFMEP